MKPLFKSKISLWASVLALVVIIGVGATLALMASPSNSVTNSFSAADIDTEIEETITDGNKQVSIKNYGPSDAYVRARIMVSGVKPENVKIVDTEPVEGTVEADKVYLVMQNNGNENSKWTKEVANSNDTYSDDFYYYLDVLTKDESSKNLLKKVVLGKDLQGEDFLKNEFSVTIYHESVLAINKTADLATVKAAFDAAQPNP